MTNEEATEQIERIIYYYESLDMDDEEKKDLESLNMAVFALGKQVPKKPRLRKGCNWIYRCPNCTHLLYWTDEPKNHGTKYEYCPDCGQHIDWEGA